MVSMSKSDHKCHSKPTPNHVDPSYWRDRILERAAGSPLKHIPAAKTQHEWLIKRATSPTKTWFPTRWHRLAKWVHYQGKTTRPVMVDIVQMANLNQLITFGGPTLCQMSYLPIVREFGHPRGLPARLGNLRAQLATCEPCRSSDECCSEFTCRWGTSTNQRSFSAWLEPYFWQQRWKTSEYFRVVPSQGLLT